jgi:hypothetical protein
MAACREVYMEASMADRVEERWERRREEGMGHHLEEHRICKFQRELFVIDTRNCRVFFFSPHERVIAVPFTR